MVFRGEAVKELKYQIVRRIINKDIKVFQNDCRNLGVLEDCEIRFKLLKNVRDCLIEKKMKNMEIKM